MKRCMILFGLAFISLVARSQQSFVKEHHQFKADTTIEVTVLFKKSFYCLMSNGQVFVINSGSDTIDTTYHDNSKSIGLTDVHLVNDTLFGNNRNGTFYLDIKTHSWAAVKSAHGVYPGYLVFEDDKYSVTSTCSGEWGGTIYFHDKKTKKTYEHTCTCTVSVLKQNNEYNVTASLAHMAGFTHIFRISDPTHLKRHSRKSPKARFYSHGKKFIYAGDDESNSKKGSTQLVDSVGITALASSIDDSKIYYLVGDYRSAHIDTIQNNKLVRVEDITNLRIQSDDSIGRYCSGRRVYTFKNSNATGFYLFEDGRLTVYISDLKK